MKLEYLKEIIINGDNLSVIKLVKNLVYHARRKHILKKYHNTRDIHRGGGIELKYFCRSDMLADMLTKNLPKPSQKKLAKMLL